MAQRKTDKQLLDEALAAGQTGDSIMAGAKAVLGKRSVLDDINDDAASQAAGRRAEESLTTGGKIKRYGAPIVDALKTAAIPASFLGGPVGMAAGAALVADGINNAVDDPSATNVGMAGVGMLPFAGPIAKTMGRVAPGAKKVMGAVERFMPNQPNPRAGAAVADDVAENLMPITPPKFDVRTGADQFTNAPAAGIDATFDAKDLPMGLQELSRAGSQKFMNREFAANQPIVRKMTDQGVFGSAKQRLNTSVPPGLKGNPGKYPMPNPIDEMADTVQVVDDALPPRWEPQGGPMGDEIQLNDMLEGITSAAGPGPKVQRVPMGVGGDEFAGVKPFSKENALTPEELALEDEFWETLIRGR